MNYKHNIRYFQNGDGIKTLGAALIIFGAFSFFFISSYDAVWSYVAYMLSYVEVPVGLFLFYWNTSRQASDKDIEEAIEEICSAVKIPWEEDKKLSARRRKSIDPLIIRGYEYEEGVMLRKTKNGTLCSSRYIAAEIAVLEDVIHLTQNVFPWFVRNPKIRRSKSPSPKSIP